MRKIYPTYTGEYWSDWQRAVDAPHALIAGCTGSGKSVLLHSLIWNLLIKSPNEVQFCLIDPKRIELSRYKRLPHVLKYAQDAKDAEITLDYVISVMESRYKLMESRNCGKVFTELYVIIDELADLMVTDKRTIMPRLQRIAQLGRSAGIHLLCATQSPSRLTIPAGLTLNFTDRICLHCDSAIESRQTIGVAGGELLPQYGEALYKSPQGVERLYVPMTNAQELQSRIEFWLNARPKIKIF